MPDKEESLILMARNEFGQLTEAEEKAIPGSCSRPS